MSRHPTPQATRSNSSLRFALRPTAIAVHLLLAGVAVGGWVGAAQAQTATAASTRSYNIPAGPLNAVLTRFLGESGVLLSGSTELAQGKQSPGVQGNLTPDAALAALLAGTGLQAVADAQGRYVLRPAPVVTRSGEAQLAPVTVTAGVDSPGSLPKPFAGGQVARGGRAGVFGNLDVMETPFSTTAFTQQFVEDTQATRVSDVVKVDPGVRSSWGGATSDEVILIRGLRPEITLNGLAGLAPPRNSVTEPYERIEVIKGPNGLTGGALFSNGLGGSVNLVTKRASSDPITRLTGLYASPGNLGMAVDVGRRFGEDKSIGVRVNGVLRDGDLGAKGTENRLGVGSIALDYAGERVRASLDVIHQDRRLSGFYGDIFLVAPGIDLPSAPKASDAPRQDWNYTDIESTTILAAGEIDLGPRTLLSASHGQEKTMLVESSAYARIVGSDGTGENFYNGTYDIPQRRKSSEVAIQHGYDLGATKHLTRLAWAEQYWRSDFGGEFSSVPAFTASIYNWPKVAPPSGAPYQVNKGVPLWMSSVALSHRLQAFDDRLNILVSLRDQRIEQGALDQSRVYPSWGVLYRLTPAWSIYASQLRQLQRGPTAPNTGVINPGAQLAPYESTQNEIGAKWDFGGWGTAVALFSTTIPNAIIVPSGTPGLGRFALDGEQAYRGIDWTAYGEPAKGWRVIGGILLLDAKQEKTQGGTNEGNQVPGAVKLRASLNVEKDVFQLPGLTLTGRVAYEGRQYADSANQQRIPNFTIVDLGARYRINPRLVARLNIENVADKAYWQGTEYSGLISLGTPRTVRGSVSYDF